MYGNSQKNLQDEDTKFKPESPYASAKTLDIGQQKIIEIILRFLPQMQ